jgi:hypothetical protein
MKKNIKILTKLSIFIFTVLLISTITTAQTNREVLTNIKIIDLVKLGLGEDIIVAKIRQSTCDCQTDTDSLTQLKNAKVPNSIILEMLNATSGNKVSVDGATEKSKTESAPNQTADNKSIFSRLKEPGIYLNDNGELKLIEPSVFSGTKSNFLIGVVTYGIKKTKIRATVRGKNANMIVSTTNPEFYFVFNPELQNSGSTMSGLFWGMPATSPAEFMLVQMKAKEKIREVVIGETGLFSGESTGASDEDIRDYTFEKLKPGIYKVNLKRNLVIGEYCFYFASNVTGLGIGGGKIFDFSIASKQ